MALKSSDFDCDLGLTIDDIEFFFAILVVAFFSQRGVLVDVLDLL